VTFTDPELAHVGLTEAQARDRAGGVSAALALQQRPRPGRARAEAHQVVTEKRGRILGATIVGASAGERITAWTLAIGKASIPYRRWYRGAISDPRGDWKTRRDNLFHPSLTVLGCGASWFVAAG
jgi:hypothetical protein